ncbi:sulfotransferase family 2 domain-containing protein [Acidisphaera sp. S103]|uniref:sulfotransferase family 2 domain-containing protein n=1 Tax=Acidisphaera sp. S103 TaxID=1747223 RepID=UPI00131E45CB|nr:sulfotransferase family 2 domain-containing protein [Acidisphaera sp. S103]
MIVSHANRFIFFHNPKCAGTSFRDMLKPYHDDPFTFWGIFHAPYFRNDIDHTHLRLWEMQAQFPKIFACTDTYNSVIFVRDPYARFLSAVNEHVKKFQPQIDLATMPAARRVEVVEALIQKLLSIANIMTNWRFIHFSPQLWYLRLGDRTVPRHIIPMGDDDTFVREALTVLGLPDLPMQHHNPSPIDLTPALASPIVTKFVREFYADDFAFLRSDERLTGLTTPLTQHHQNS